MPNLDADMSRLNPKQLFVWLFIIFYFLRIEFAGCTISIAQYFQHKFICHLYLILLFMVTLLCDYVKNRFLAINFVEKRTI